MDKEGKGEHGRGGPRQAVTFRFSLKTLGKRGTVSGGTLTDQNRIMENMHYRLLVFGEIKRKTVKSVGGRLLYKTDVVLSYIRVVKEDDY